MFNCYIRPLREEDSAISYKWRNNPLVWRYTGSRPDREITPEIERDWIKVVLERKNELRFAICLKENDTYIGNVQLTSITEKEAEFHIFIGDPNYWGKGLGIKATKKMLDYAQSVLALNDVYLWVSIENIPAIKAYRRCDFEEKEKKDNQLKMTKKL